MNELLVIGFGSEILSDEAIIPRIMDQIRQDYPSSDFKQCLTLSMDTLEQIKDYKKIIILDTVKTRSGITGTVSVYPVQEYLPTLHLENLHDVSLPVLIKLGRNLGYSIAEEIYIISIEIADHTTISNNLSHRITELYSSILTSVHGILNKEILLFQTAKPA